MIVSHFFYLDSILRYYFCQYLYHDCDYYSFEYSLNIILNLKFSVCFRSVAEVLLEGL
jgi:hypothetical protein